MQSAICVFLVAVRSRVEGVLFHPSHPIRWGLAAGARALGPVSARLSFGLVSSLCFSFISGPGCIRFDSLLDHHTHPLQSTHPPIHSHGRYVAHPRIRVSHKGAHAIHPSSPSFPQPTSILRSSTRRSSRMCCASFCACAAGSFASSRPCTGPRARAARTRLAALATRYSVFLLHFESKEPRKLLRFGIRFGFRSCRNPEPDSAIVPALLSSHLFIAKRRQCSRTS